MVKGFMWSKIRYEFKDIDPIDVIITEKEFMILAQRYRKILHEPGMAASL